jgi:hypothetical protein
MQDNENVVVPSIFTDETFLLCLAVGLAIVFVGLLVFDMVMRSRRARHYRWRQPEGLRANLVKAIQNAKAFRSDLERMLKEYSRRKRRHGLPPSNTTPGAAWNRAEKAQAPPGEKG